MKGPDGHDSNLPVELIQRLKEQFGLRYFVETGTAVGETTARASEHFERVWTIEAWPRAHAWAKRRLAEKQHVQCLLGHSPVVLKEVMTWLDQPTLFWLDAHWSGGGTAKVHGECPLLDELRAIGGLDGRHVVAIDDAQFFLGTPPEPHKREDWPTVSHILDVDVLASPFIAQVIDEQIILLTPEEFDA